jgi:small redox-active disulfide protein 2
MIIKILGTGCPRCVKLEKNTKEALKQLDLQAEVVKVTAVQEMLSYGIMSSPALVINEKVVMYGQNPSIEEIIKLINDNK